MNTKCSGGWSGINPAFILRTGATRNMPKRHSGFSRFRQIFEVNHGDL